VSNSGNDVKANRILKVDEADMSTNMTIAEARKVMWLKTNYRPIGELLDQGQLSISDLKWAAAKAYDPRLKLSASILLQQLDNLSETGNTPTTQVTQQSIPQTVVTPLTVERARSTIWPFGQQKGRTFGDLLDEQAISLKDLGYAVENARDRNVQAAARTLLIAKVNEEIREPQSRRAPPHVIAAGRSFSEQQQLIWMLYAGVGIGIFAGIGTSISLSVIIREIMQPSLPANSASAIKAFGTTEIIVGVAIIGIICFLGWMVLRVIPNAIMDQFAARLRRFRQGQIGEERTISILHFALDESWYIFRNLELPGRNRGDIDVVIVGPPGVFALEVKAYHGHYRNIGDRWEYHANNQWRPARRSPSQQAKRSSKQLSSFFKSNGITQWVTPIVVWTNSSSNVEVENASVAVWPLSQLPEELGNLWGNQTANDTTIKRVTDVLVKLTDQKRAEIQRGQ
jgi:hypothetical protein